MKLRYIPNGGIVEASPGLAARLAASSRWELVDAPEAPAKRAPRKPKPKPEPEEAQESETEE